MDSKLTNRRAEAVAVIGALASWAAVCAWVALAQGEILWTVLTLSGLAFLPLVIEVWRTPGVWVSLTRREVFCVEYGLVGFVTVFVVKCI
jgi:hypothetical protein